MDVPRPAKIPTDERGLPVRNLIAAAVLVIGGFTHLMPAEVEPIDSSPVVLVADNPFNQLELEDTATETVPTPEPDPVPNALGSPETDRLRELAEQLTKDAAEIGKRADELKPALSSSYWETGPTAPTVCECKCECKCLDEAQMRKIVSDEITYALAAKATLSSSQPGSGSNGGTVSGGGSSGYSSSPLGNSYYMPPSSSVSWSPPVYSSPSAGGSVSGSVSWPLSSTVQTSPNVRDRIASRLASPLRDFSGAKVTIHKLANGPCPACDRWLRDVAPKLQAEGITVTQISDITSGTAPQIDICPDPSQCIRINGSASYLQIIGMLR